MPSAVPVITCTTDKREGLLALFKVYLHQLREGCGDPQCPNFRCASSPKFEYRGKSDDELVKICRSELLHGAIKETPVWYFCDSMWQPHSAWRLSVLLASTVEALLDRGEAARGELAAALEAGLAVGADGDARGEPTAAWAFIDVPLLRGSGNVWAVGDAAAGTAAAAAAAAGAAGGSWFAEPLAEGAKVWVARAPPPQSGAAFARRPGGPQEELVPHGSRVDVVQMVADGWAEVAWQGQVGFVRADAICELPALRLPAAAPPLGLDLPRARALWRRLDQSAGAVAAPALARSIAALRRQSEQAPWGEAMRREALPLGTIERSLSARRDLINHYLTWRLVRLFALLFESPTATDAMALDRMGSLCIALANVQHFVGAQLALVWGSYAAPDFADLVDRFQNFITLQLHATEALSPETCAACTCLGIAYEANYCLNPSGILPHTAFYNQAVNTMVRTESDFRKWMAARGIQRQPLPLMHILQPPEPEAAPRRASGAVAAQSPAEVSLGIVRRQRPHPAVARQGFDDTNFTFISAAYIIGPAYKWRALQLDTRAGQQQELRGALMQQFQSGNFQMNVTDDHIFLVLHIDRDDVIGSALQEVMRNKDKIKRELRIKFRTAGAAEEGIDEGGVKKEFFLLLTKQLFDPDYGMFSENQSTRVQWFQPRVKCHENDLNFHLTGIMLGMALYNQVLLDINFPLACYKKLLNIAPDFGDVKQLDPGLHKSLQQLLDWDEQKAGATVEETFCCSFAVSHDVYGEVIQEPLVPGGCDIPVTAANRREYVDAYVRYVFDTSIGKNFEEFYNGFHLIVGAQCHLLSLLRPEELELMVIGNPNLDLSQLEVTARYEGYTPEHRIVREFWEIVKELDVPEQRRFLKFTTGSDRVPVGGLESLGLVIGKNGDDSEQLPTAHTCFNHLLIPEYPTKEKLKVKLLSAISNCEGFGLM